MPSFLFSASAPLLKSQRAKRSAGPSLWSGNSEGMRRAGNAGKRAGSGSIPPGEDRAGEGCAVTARGAEQGTAGTRRARPGWAHPPPGSHLSRGSFSGAAASPPQQPQQPSDRSQARSPIGAAGEPGRAGQGRPHGQPLPPPQRGRPGLRSAPAALPGPAPPCPVLPGPALPRPARPRRSCSLLLHPP